MLSKCLASRNLHPGKNEKSNCRPADARPAEKLQHRKITRTSGSMGQYGIVWTVESNHFGHLNQTRSTSIAGDGGSGATG
ncbi:hypothetical protein OUZ56_004247 [Daphnia magna]|uniref:Uncharacterized protein n=1 Tax=Daphnia magna TaxID=35525 RepID=A0ABQ9YP65_9CRUS|nr:hypothetical protein OUZ56_004247 [Daphnia magna]